MLERFLLVMLFVLIYSGIQAAVMRKFHTTPLTELQKQVERVKTSKKYETFYLEKQIKLKKSGVDIFLKDGMTVSQWYAYKASIASIAIIIAMFITKGVMKLDYWWIISGVVMVIGWLFLDLYLRLSNKRSNEAMMPDIMEMSRSVLYGKRGGQYIADAMKDAVVVVENKRLKTAFIRLRNNLDAGMSIDECLDELELEFSNGEISAFCTVIRSLQFTGQVDESLKTLEANIAREQVGVNKRRCVVLENKTMMYVMLIAFDILITILYCIIMKLLDMQIGF